MPHKQALTMMVANRSDFCFLQVAVFALLLVAALSSPKPVFLLTLTLVVLAAAIKFPRIIFAKVRPGRRTVSVARDGELRFTWAEDEAAEGELFGTQWCTRYFAVLRYRSDSARQYLLLIAARQSPESFRQLCVWLRHNHYNEGKDQS